MDDKHDVQVEQVSASDLGRSRGQRSLARAAAVGLAILSAAIAVVVAVGFVLLRMTGMRGLLGMVIVAEIAAATAVIVVAMVRGRGALAVATTCAGSSFLFWYGALFGVALDSWTSNLWFAGLSGAAAATAFTISLERGRGRAVAAAAGGLVAGMLACGVVVWIGQTLG